MKFWKNHWVWHVLNSACNKCYMMFGCVVHSSTHRLNVAPSSLILPIVSLFLCGHLPMLYTVIRICGICGVNSL